MSYLRKPYEGEAGMVPPYGRRAKPEYGQAFTRREKACVFLKITHPGYYSFAITSVTEF